MIWKPKDRELTQEEAIEAARLEVAKQWFNGPPLLVGVDRDGIVTAHPLDADFSKSAWLLLFADLTDFNGQAATRFFVEWSRRYHPNRLNFLFVLELTYGFLESEERIRHWIKEWQIPGPVVLDTNGLLRRAFGAVRGEPKVTLLDNRTVPFEAAGKQWRDGLELKIQGYLRERDPGLPLPPPLETLSQGAETGVRVEFGRRRAGNVPSPGFFTGPDGIGHGSFQAPADGRLVGGEFALAGIWSQNDEKIMTSDSKAQLAIPTAYRQVSLVMESSSRIADLARVSVELDGSPVPEHFSGESLTYDDEGRSILRVGEPGIYQAVKGLDGGRHFLRFTAISADQTPVAFYGLRMA